MIRASFLLLALSSLVLPSCNSVSLGGSQDDAGNWPTGGDGGGTFSGGGAGGSMSTAGPSSTGGSSGNGGTSPIDACTALGCDVDAGPLRTDAASCSGPNPAARTCRNTASECIPSTCTCGGLGLPTPTWGCSADCRALPMCGVDGGSSADANSVDAGVAPGCDPAIAAQAVSAAGLTAVGDVQTLSVDLPSNFSSSTNWGVKESACREGGYDLSTVAGKSVCLASFGSTGLCQQLPATIWVVMSDGIVQCVYQSVSLNPGIYSVHDSACSAAVDAGTCSGARIDNSTAATAFAQYIRQVNSGLNSAVTFSAEERTVPSLWDTMQAQLFFAKIFAEDGSVWQEVAFLYRQCKVTPLTDDQLFGLIQSGVVVNGAFYYSWVWGSGISRTSMGKIVPAAAAGPGLVKTTSVGYLNLDLVVVLENERLAVYQAVVNWGKFNEWESRGSKPTGFLKDYGDRLAVVDENGKELTTTIH